MPEWSDAVSGAYNCDRWLLSRQVAKLALPETGFQEVLHNLWHHYMLPTGKRQ